MKIKAELTFPLELKDEPIICNLCKQFDIIVKILEASFSTDTGWAILIVEGQEAELDRAFKYLKDWNIEIESIEKNP
ncbi:MAG: NIL domain-containing protein [Candidatus Omnitrophica bacterium]|nr:NIL domain-containing protein [Candidatus Omnitrophota bacterium]MDD5591708.1 NIL domain-containing protein [Candidatus Omnitrophota bacterium]